MTHQRGQRFLPADVPDVDFVVLAATGHETLVDAPEAGIDRVVALGYALEATNQTLVLEIP